MYKSDDFLEGFGYVQHHKKADNHYRNTKLGAQKVVGVLLMIAGVASVPVTNCDITAAAMLIPLGIYLVLTNTLYLN